MNLSTRMKDKIAFVTGGNSGIGAAVVQRLQDEGATVIIGDITVEAAKDAAGKITHVKLDVGDAADVDAAIAAIVRDHGRLDCLVHSAGIARTAPFLETSADLFDQVMRVNVRGTFLICQAAARAMKETGGGSIVNLGSISGHLGNTIRIAYGGSKGGVHQMSKIMASELGPYNIRVNVVAPGPIATPMTEVMYTAEVREQWYQRLSLARLGKAEEVASAVAFLASDDASYITGHVLLVDGGMATRGMGPKD